MVLSCVGGAGFREELLLAVLLRDVQTPYDRYPHISILAPVGDQVGRAVPRVRECLMGSHLGFDARNGRSFPTQAAKDDAILSIPRGKYDLLYSCD